MSTPSSRASAGGPSVGGVSFAPLRSASGRPLELEVALESLSALLQSPMPAGSPTRPTNTLGMTGGGARATDRPTGSGSSGRSLSPPPRTISGSRLHLHPTSTPPRVSGSSILHSVASKKLFATSTTHLGGTTGVSHPSVKSAATAAFIAAQEASKRSRGTSAGNAMSLGGFGAMAATTAASASASPTALPSPSVLTSSPSSAAASASLLPSTSAPRQASYRRTLEDALARSLHSLSHATRHANQVQTHVVAGILALRRGEWRAAEAALRRADELYRVTLEKGSGLARLEGDERDEKNPTPIIGAAAAAGTTPSADETKEDEEPEEIELTQPMETEDLPSTQPTAAAAAAADPIASASDGAGASSATTAATAPTAFVARKAADIKLCLAIAIWKGAYYRSPQPQQQPDDVHSKFQEAKSLFVDALELEGGHRLAVWTAFATFLAATQSVQVGQSVLIQALHAHHDEHAAQTDAALTSAGGVVAHRAEEESRDAEDDDGGGWAVDSLKNNLACLQLMSGESDEAIMTLQDILEDAASLEDESADSSQQQPPPRPAHLGAISNYSVICMKQGDFAAAEKLIRFLVRHDPCNSMYWTHLALCLELQLDLNSSAGHAHAGSGGSTTPLVSEEKDAGAGGVGGGDSTKEQQEARRESMRRVDADRRRQVQFAYEKARFYEPTTTAALGVDSSGEATPSTGAPAALPTGATAAAPILAPSAGSWPFRLNLAQHLLALARHETSNAQVRTHHYESAESLLLSVKDYGSHSTGGAALERSAQRGRTEVWTALGDVYAARSVSALLESPEAGGGSEGSKRFKHQAISAYAQALRLHPFNQTAWNQLSVLFMHSGDVRKAIVFFSRLAERMKRELGVGAPTPTTGGAGGGSDGGATGTKEEAKADEEQKPKASGSSDEASMRYTPLSSADLDALSRTSSPASHLDHLASVLCNLGVAFQLYSMDGPAGQAYMDSLRLSSEQAPTYMNLGNLHRSLKQTDSALRTFSRALAIKPDYAMCWSNVALLYVQQEDWIMAYHCMEKAHAHGPHLNTVRSNRSRLSLLLTKLGFSIPLPPPSPSQTFSSVAEVNAAMNRSFRAPPMASQPPMLPMMPSFNTTGMMPMLPLAPMPAPTPAAAAAPPKKRAAGRPKKQVGKRRKGAAAAAVSDSETTSTEVSMDSTDVEEPEEEDDEAME